MSLDRLKHFSNVLKDFSFLDDKAIEIVKQYESEIIDLNTEEQLFRLGQLRTGKKIQPGYRPFTVEIKRQRGQPVDRVTLQDTGEFYEGFFIEYSANFFFITSSDPKTQDLVNRYGSEIFGLSEKSLVEIRIIIHQELLESLRKELFDD